MIDLVKHIEYQRWANAKVAGQIRPLSAELTEKEFGGSFPSIRLTLLHMLQADYRWLHRLRGVPIIEIPAEWQGWDKDTLLSTWLSVQDQLAQQVSAMAPQGDQPVKFTTMKGDSFTLPLSEIVTHVVNHSSYHRGQLTNFLRMAGAIPVGTDYFIYIASKGK